MKPAHLLLAASVATNVALLSAFALKPTLVPPAMRDYFARGEPPPASAESADASAAVASGGAAAARSTAKSRVRGASDKTAAARQARLWSALQTDDLPTLISRLRAAGFPPAVIRGVVNAQLEARYAARLDALVAKMSETPYWKPESTAIIGGSRIYDEVNQIYRERSRALRELMGDDFYALADSDHLTAQRRRYGDIPKQKVELVQRIADDYAEMMAQVRTATQGIMLPEDREKLALLERERRADLLAVLSPEEFEQFEMRSSVLTNRLRATMTVMDASEDEFRTIFRIFHPVADQVYPSGGVITATAVEQRRQLQESLFAQIKGALGEPRFTDFSRAHNPEYQALNRLAQNEQIPKDAVVRAFSLRDAASTESNRIIDDPASTPDQKRVEMKALAERMRAEAVAILGPKAGDAYLKNANWFSTLERGAAFNFRFDGGTTAVRGIPQNPRPRPPGTANSGSAGAPAAPGAPTPPPQAGGGVLHLGN